MRGRNPNHFASFNWILKPRENLILATDVCIMHVPRKDLPQGLCSWGTTLAWFLQNLVWLILHCHDEIRHQTCSEMHVHTEMTCRDLNTYISNDSTTEWDWLRYKDILTKLEAREEQQAEQLFTHLNEGSQTCVRSLKVHRADATKLPSLLPTKGKGRRFLQGNERRHKLKEQNMMQLKYN